ncbi:MAG: hypothetical protein ACI4WS_07215 [Oscillospiraceae bacterium]
MKKIKVMSAVLSAAAALTAMAVSASAETVSIYMSDAGYGVNGGKSFSPDGIIAYTNTLGELADLYDTIDFTISATDLAGHDDLTFQVYVAAGDWSIWANGGETPAIEEAGTEYTFSLNVDDIAAEYGADMVICDMGFQIMSAEPGVVEVTYNAEFNANGAADTNSDAVSEPVVISEDKGSPDTGVEGVGAVAALAVVAAGALALTGKRRK